MAYKQNVDALANKHGITNSPKLKEEDLTIAELVFKDQDGNLLERIIASPMNMGSRLFIKDLAMGSMDDTLVCDQALRDRAAVYFAEMWDNEPGSKKHPLLYMIRTAHMIEIVWKQRVSLDTKVFRSQKKGYYVITPYWHGSQWMVSVHNGYIEAGVSLEPILTFEARKLEDDPSKYQLARDIWPV